MRTSALRSMTILAVSLAFLTAAPPMRVPMASAGGGQDSITFNGLPHVALGDATLDTANASLIIGNIGSTGNDGVEVSGLSFRTTHFEAELGDLNAAGLPTEGAFLETVGFGSLDGAPDRMLGSSRVTQIGVANSGTAGYEITADFSPMGATKFIAEVLSNGDLVYRATGLMNPVAVIESWPSVARFALVKDVFPWPEGGPSSGTIPEASWSTSQVGAVLIVEGRLGARDTTVMGDRVRILAEDPSAVGGSLRTLDRKSVV